MKEYKLNNGASPQIFKWAVELRKNQTATEIILGKFLKERPLKQKFRAQHPFGMFILDFYCHKLGLVIEIDGRDHYLKKSKDRQRDRALNQIGISVLRFTNFEINNSLDLVKSEILDEIERILRATSIDSNPLPQT